MDLNVHGPQGTITKVKTTETKAEAGRAGSTCPGIAKIQTDQVTHIRASIQQCKIQSDSFSYQISDKTLQKYNTVIHKVLIQTIVL